MKFEQNVEQLGIVCIACDTKPAATDPVQTCYFGQIKIRYTELSAHMKPRDTNPTMI